MNKDKKKSLLFEFLRYIVVGGIAFIVDFTSLYIFNEFVFHKLAYRIYLSTAIAFTFGLIVNYILSIEFVFLQAKDQGKGRDPKSFFIICIIGIIGLGLTELGMYIGCELLNTQIDKCLIYFGNLLEYNLVRYDYILVKCFVTIVVLFWNYAARKIIVFR